MARAMGLGVLPWSPLASGVLTGKYTRADLDHGGGAARAEGSRKNVAAANGALTERALGIAGVLADVAAKAGVTPAQAALAWTTRERAVTAPIIGARTLAQLEENIGALGVSFTDDQLVALDEVSRIAPGYPHEFLARPLTREVMFGGARIETVA